MEQAFVMNSMEENEIKSHELNTRFLAVNVNNVHSWDVMAYSLVDVYQHIWLNIWNLEGTGYTLKMKALCPSEMSVSIYRNTRSHTKKEEYLNPLRMCNIKIPN
jgi:hypothetical protein